MTEQTTDGTAIAADDGPEFLLAEDHRGEDTIWWRDGNTLRPQLQVSELRRNFSWDDPDGGVSRALWARLTSGIGLAAICAGDGCREIVLDEHRFCDEHEECADENGDEPCDDEENW